MFRLLEMYAILLIAYIQATSSAPSLAYFKCVYLCIQSYLMQVCLAAFPVLLNTGVKTLNAVSSRT